jgi:hypothetical protein
MSTEEFDRLIDSYREGAESLTMPGVDAAQSDLVASEFHYALIHLLDLARELRTKGL